MKLSRIQIRRLIESVINEEEVEAERKDGNLKFKQINIAGAPSVDVDAYLKNKKEFRKYIKGNRFNPQNNKVGAKAAGRTMAMLASRLMDQELGSDIKKQCQEKPLMCAHMLFSEIAKKDKKKAESFARSLRLMSQNLLKNPDDEQVVEDFINAVIDQTFK